MSQSLNLSRQYFMKKLNIRFATDIYKHLAKNPSIFTPENLSTLTPLEIFHHIVFLGTHPERRNQGEQAKIYALKCLKAFKNQIPQQSFEQNSQLLLALSNVLLYDEKMIKTIIKQVDEVKETLSIQDITKFQHCLYKLNIHDEPLNQYFFQKTLDNPEKLSLHDYVQYMHIRSNLFHLGFVQYDDLYWLMKCLQKKFSQQQNHFYTSKFCFQFCQMFYNFYPEITQKQIGANLQPDKSNPFSQFFNDFLRDFILSKQLVDRKLNFQSFEYTETENVSNMLKVKEDEIKHQLTPLEKCVGDTLNKLNYKNQRGVRVLLYDVDYLVNDNIIINCNDPVHFVEDFDGNVLGINPNHLMQTRHLSQFGLNVQNVNYYEWDGFNEQEKIEKIRTIVEGS